MSKKRKILLYYCLLLSIFIPVSAVVSKPTLQGALLALLFLPVVGYIIFGLRARGTPGSIWAKFILYYSFIVVSLLTLTGFLSARGIPDLLAAIFFLPISIYFLKLILPRSRKTLIIPEVIMPKPHLPGGVKGKPGRHLEGETDPIERARRTDRDRRAFLKLIGTAGAGVFLMSIFTKKASAAFFGSVPGPGTVALKDTAGAQVDPAAAHPTDGYKIAQLDDSSPAYYGFTNKTGAWFIMKEDSSGNYRYTKGTSSFSTNWTNRASLTYDYFDVIF